MTGVRPLWRAFPWDPAAADGDPFSALHRPRSSGSGRFDLPGVTACSSWYFAESPEHAVAERIQDLRNQSLEPADLEEAGHPLAIASYTLEAAVSAGILDLCDPAVLAREQIAPDTLAARDRRVTQQLAGRIHAAAHPGFRWWSALIGEWHTVVLFTDRIPLDALTVSTPVPLAASHPAVTAACEVLGVEIGLRAAHRDPSLRSG